MRSGWQQVRYTQPAQEVTRLDCMNEVEHMGGGSSDWKRRSWKW